jgi:glycerate kinase
VDCGGNSQYWWRWQTPANLPGSGAAGGLGFGLMSFLGAKADRGFNLFDQFAKLEKHLLRTDLVITGEGCIDKSTFMGKGVGEIAWRCSEKNIPCLAFAGSIGAPDKAKNFFVEAHSLLELTSVEKAKSNPAAWLERLAERAAKKLVES